MIAKLIERLTAVEKQNKELQNAHEQLFVHIFALKGENEALKSKKYLP